MPEVMKTAPEWMPWAWTATGMICSFVMLFAVPWAMKADRRLTIIETSVSFWAKKERALDDLYKRMNKLEQKVAALTGRPGSDG